MVAADDADARVVVAQPAVGVEGRRALLAVVGAGVRDGRVFAVRQVVIGHGRRIRRTGLGRRRPYHRPCIGRCSR